MMALFARKKNPIEVGLEYTSRIDAVAYPLFRQSAFGGTMTHGEPEEYSYLVDAGVKSYYRAEGDLRCHGLEDNLAFVFEMQNLLGSDHRLALGKEPRQISAPLAMAPFYFLRRWDIGVPKRRKDIASSIQAAIQKEFLHTDHNRPFQDLQSPPYVHSLLISMSQAAAADYRKILELQLRENPTQPILPKIYRYDIDGKIFDNAKLIKVE